MSDLYEELPEVYRYDPDAPNYEAFDFGFSDPWVCLDVQRVPCDIVRSDEMKEEYGEECPFDKWFVWREYYMAGFTPEHHVDNLKARKNPLGFRVSMGFGDSAGPGDISVIRSRWCPIVAEPEAKQDFRQAFSIIQSLLEPISCVGPHLMFDPRCVNCIRELGLYKEPSKRDPEASITGKPESKHDHVPDALRYLFMHIFVLQTMQSLQSVADMYEYTGEGELHSGSIMEDWFEDNMRIPTGSVFSLDRETIF